ncbi:ribosomal protein L7/L12, partial [Gammaproteobacteria bacterium]|nr:ribosomal protein L7/L12 [Gammaproteobacteria bacterium]
IIKTIEEEDENKLIHKIHGELLKYSSFIKLIDDLKKISQNIDRSDLSFSNLEKSKEQFSRLSKRARDFFVNFGVPEAGVTTLTVDETINAEEQPEFEIFLADVGERKIDVIKAVKTITGFGLEKAKVIVDFAPASVKAVVDKDEAEQAKSLLEKAGAKVELNKII